MKPPTISDVARVAGVSVASVSRALRSSNGVTDELHERVMSAVQQTGYRPQRVHKNPTQTRWLAVLVNDIVQPFHLQVIAGIQEQAEAHGYFCAIIRLTGGSGQLSTVLKQMRDIPLAGLASVGIEISAEEWIRHYEEAKAPIVVLNTEVNHPKIASIMVNFQWAAMQATRHLLDLGHTRIVYLGDYDHRISAMEFRGLKAALARRSIVYPDEYCISIPHTAEGASQGISRLMSLPAAKRPTAIFAFDDEIAIDILNTLRYYGLRVPDDISVMGFDNIPMAAHAYPPLTTVEVPKRRIGQQMAHLLEDLLNNDRAQVGATIIDGSLVVRRSTGPAPFTPAV